MNRLMAGLIAALWLVPTVSFAKGPEALTDLNQALEQAKKEKKLLFIQFGREACENCQALRGYIRDGSLRLFKTAFVYVDLNCDDRKVNQQFREKFKVKGTMLPFVVVASPDGEQLAARTGYGSPDDYEKLIRSAKKDKK